MDQPRIHGCGLPLGVAARSEYLRGIRSRRTHARTDCRAPGADGVTRSHTASTSRARGATGPACTGAGMQVGSPRRRGQRRCTQPRRRDTIFEGCRRRTRPSSSPRIRGILVEPRGDGETFILGSYQDRRVYRLLECMITSRGAPFLDHFASQFNAVR